MNRKHLIAIAAFGGLMAWATGAYSAPLYVGLQAGNGAINTVINDPSGNGPFTFNLTEFGTTGVYASGSVEGTPPLPEPQLLSNTLSVSGEHDTGGTVSIYVTELNQFPLMPFGSFVSSFANAFAPANTLGSKNQTANTATQVVESTYVTPCSNLNPGCPASYIYAEGTLLSTTTFTQGGATTVTDSAAFPGGLTAPYATTEVYTITFAAPSGLNLYGQVSSSVNLQLIPEPASLAVLGGALAGFGAIRRRRRTT